MKQTSYFIVMIAAVYNLSCQKGNSPVKDKEPKIKTDTLVFYGANLTNGKPVIYSSSFDAAKIDTFVSSAQYPFATNRRMVYIKNGNILAYSKLDGIYKQLAALTHPLHPCLSLDSKLVAVIDKPADQYQLLVLDTLGTGNITTLLETTDEIGYPCFSSNGLKLGFSRKTTDSSSSLFITSVDGVEGPKRLTPNAAGIYDDYCAVFDETVYFSRTRMVNGVLSSEICKTDFNGSAVTQVTNFTQGWTIGSFFIKNIRKMDLTTLAFASNKDGANSDIFLLQLGSPANTIRITNSSQPKSFPCVLYNYEE